MNELLGQYWGLILAALVIGVVVAWFVFAANRKTTVERTADAVDETAAPARRNQALIDAPPAAAVPNAPPAPVSAAPAPAPAPAGISSVDDLTRLKGVGPKLSALLGTLGVTSFAQIAGWSDADIDRIDAQLGNFQGRIRRDDWVEQARLLAAGDTAGYENRFGKL